MTAKLVDVIIFGASGFTGKFTVFQATKILTDFSWGIAGRCETKLRHVLNEMEKKSGSDLSKIPIILADIKNQASLEKMASQCRIIVNCCGPYRFFGEQVVEACINSGTHHVDVSGEPQYMEKMQLKYNKLAVEKKVYVVSACGFDSIPADLGLVFLEENFGGELNSVETYLTTREKGSKSGSSIHYGTWESAVYGLAHASELRGLRSQLYQERTPTMHPKLKNRSLIHKSQIVGNMWCLPFPGSDRSVVMRSQRFFYDLDKKRPVQMQAYITFPSLVHIISVIFVASIFGILSKFSCGRYLLLKFPKLFSLGVVSHEGPSEEKMEATHFSMSFYGEGWAKEEILVESTDKHTGLPTKHMVTKVTGTNPGYGATCVALLLSAKTILKESDKMPGAGGVLSPGAAFSKTRIISELRNHGFNFEIVSTDMDK